MSKGKPLPASVNTLDELAEVLGVTLPTVEGWIHSGTGMPVNGDGSYSPAAVRAWRRKLTSRNRRRGPEPAFPQDKTHRTDRSARSGSNGAQDAGTGTHDPEMQRFRRLRADKEELQLRKARGELISREEIDRMFTARMIAFRRSLMDLARRMAPILTCGCPQGKTQLEVQALLEEEVRNILLSYARRYDDEPEDESDDDEPTNGSAAATLH